MSQPRINATILSSVNSILPVPQRVLFIGQKTSAGSATSGALTQNIPNDGSEDDLFGENSMLAAMVRNFKLINQVTQIDAIALSDNGSGVAATGTIVLSGTATAAGTLVFNIGSRLNHSYSVDVATDDTAATVATALEALIDADTTAPVTAGVSTATVTITAVNKGTAANSIGTEVVGSVAGISVTITKLNSGATNPSMTNVFNVVGQQRYQTVCGPVEYGVSTYTDFLEPRFNVDNRVLDGVAILSATDTYANLVSTYTTENSHELVVLGNRLVNSSTYKGSSIFEIDYCIAAQFSAIRSLRLTDGADLTSYVVSPTAGDQVGGVSLASLPYHNTPFPYLPTIDIGQEFSQDEEDDLNTAGVSILANNVSRTEVVADDIVTTYKYNTLGAVDTTFKFLNSVDTASAIREAFFNYAKNNYAQTRLTAGDTVPNASMVNTNSIAADAKGLYRTLSGSDYMLVSAGEDAADFFSDNLVVEIVDLALGQVSESMKVQPVSQLREMSIPITIVFNTSSN
jgi:phage tail sheath gpL-like